MRTLSTTLLAEQKKSSVTPYLRVYLRSASGSTEYTFTTADNPNRIYSVRHREEPYGGVAIISLKNNDNFFTGKNLRGYRVRIGWGLVTSAGNEYSEPAELYVLTQRDRSEPGELLTELVCADVWSLLAQDQIFTGGTKLTGKISVGSKPSSIAEKLIGQTSGASGTIAVITTDYVVVVGVSGNFQVGETASTSSGFKIVISSVATVGAGGAPLTYAGDVSVFDIISSLLMPFVSLILDSDDPDNSATTYKPTYQIDIGSEIRPVIMDLMGFTMCGLRLRTDGMHMLYLNPSPSSADYEYDTNHVFLSELRDRRLVLPNQIFVVSTSPTREVPEFIAYATDNESYNALGKYIRSIEIIPTVSSQADAQKRADVLLARKRAELNTGTVRVPIMNCGQEVYDWIRIIDARAGSVVITGRVGAIERNYASGRYDMELRLGGLNTYASVTDEGEVKTDIQLPERPPEHKEVPKSIPWETILPKAIQGYQHDITFTADNWNTVSWSSGTIKFYDGTTQAVSAGSYTLPDATIRYIYFDLADANPNVLKVTTSYQSVMTEKTGLLCLVQRGSSSGIKARVLPSYGKEPLITADWIDMTGLKAYTFPDGTQLQGIFSTQIQAGYLKVTAQTVFEGEWYDKSGVEIDATHGINIYGKNMALTTRATKTGTVRCYVGSDGKFVIRDGYLEYRDSTDEYRWGRWYFNISKGGLCYASSEPLINLASDGAILLRLCPGTTFGLMYEPEPRRLFFGAEFDHKYCPSQPNYGYLGDSTFYWFRVYANTYYGKNTTIQSFQNHDDIALIKNLKAKRVRDKNGKEREVIDFDSLPDEVKEVSINEVTKEREEFINMGSLSSLALGAIKQLIERVEALERRIR